MKINSLKPICPVLCIVVLAGTIHISSCGSAEKAAEAPFTTEREPVTTCAVEVTGFRFEASPPDTVSLKWLGEGSAVIIDMYFSPGEEIQEGDSLFQFMEDLQIVEMERLSMELDMASAMMISDSLLLPKVDSLTLILDSLLNSKSLYLSPLNGTLEDVFIEIDQRIRPGNAVAEVSVASSELFRVSSPPDCNVSTWPSGGGGIRFIEELSGYAVYSGEITAIETRFSELLAVPRAAVYESELDSYVITVEFDTIPVSRTGEKDNNLVIILPSEPVTTGLLTWTEK